MKRPAAIAAVLVAVSLAACSDEPDATLDVVPASWGPPGICYYVASPWECNGVIGTGMQPVAMPAWWHARYHDYYDSPRYRDTRVEPSKRATYTTSTQKFAKDNAKLIKTESGLGTWREPKTGVTATGNRQSASRDVTIFTDTARQAGTPVKYNQDASKASKLLSSSSGSTAGKRGDSWGSSGGKTTVNYNKSSSSSWSSSSRSGSSYGSYGRRP